MAVLILTGGRSRFFEAPIKCSFLPVGVSFLGGYGLKENNRGAPAEGFFGVQRVWTVVGVKHINPATYFGSSYISGLPRRRPHVSLHDDDHGSSVVQPGHCVPPHPDPFGSRNSE